ncbi:hypothetical protein COL154_003618 [Colletotrichum chrysophilum]|uniref:Phosphatidylethanolamine-binding protein n=1 Tax=Colletotrichum chrysophilum TaxID=1836956 RepID=A0AAD9EPR2_9PEZI|nr:uncharacterized protein COL26b_002931 [Colletotrichum chrysophilum]KAH9243871.1 hypothetical protein K456DRAFT_29104 [Colletotrichum gloeosporioides 23]KAJ0286875.1 hypothetical protein COL940_002765 [Colletotrichum noveboracense]KAJ0293194.1 hypothetical protein CBS470a_001981 [Colletotrichum nupharicola]KAJ0320111.1 hypothetical protein Brms1b_003418 [Colletotrichum noveboracense]KAJ0352814.1 hypothetical protein KNSL1_002394 [Colletotrichum chrysophilum]
MNPYVEVTLSWLLKSSRGHDAKAFYTSPAFAAHKEQNLTVTSPDCGPSPAELKPEYIVEGGGRIPALAWTAPQDVEARVKEWLIVSEDPDAPLPTPICHGVYGGIPSERREVTAKDFEIEDESKSLLKGGFHWGKGRREGVYVAPRPLMNHGPHRYFFEVVALSEPLDKSMLEARATKEQVAEAINGKVLGWGLWIGSCERRWT